MFILKKKKSLEYLQCAEKENAGDWRGEKKEEKSGQLDQHCIFS